MFLFPCTAGENQIRGQTDKTAKETNSTCGRFSDVQQRILGVVMDSATPRETMLEGFPKSISASAIVGSAIKAVLASYLRMFPVSVASHFVEGAEAFETNPCELPMLMFYSSADPIAPSWKLDSVVADWERRGLVVHVRKFDDSPHVNHFRFYPERYKEALQGFLELCLSRIKV